MPAGFPVKVCFQTDRKEEDKIPALRSYSIFALRLPLDRLIWAAKPPYGNLAGVATLNDATPEHFFLICNFNVKML